MNEERKGRLELYFVVAILVVLLGSAAANYAMIVANPNSVPSDTQPIPAGSYVVRVIATQWTWSFEYPNNTTSVGTFTVPVNTSITLVATSVAGAQGSAVIHDLLIPQMDVQIYAVPGQNNTVTFEPTHTGSYYFECVEYCGEFHYEMRGYMEVVS